MKPLEEKVTTVLHDPSTNTDTLKAQPSQRTTLESRLHRVEAAAGELTAEGDSLDKQIAAQTKQVLGLFHRVHTENEADHLIESLAAMQRRRNAIRRELKALDDARLRYITRLRRARKGK